MRILLFLLFFSCCALEAAGATLKARLETGSPGDYIVTAQDKNLSMLRIREKTKTHLLLEEITAPEASLESKNISWTSWLEKGAPGHSGWLLYEIDLSTGQLLECFSISQKGWISVDEPILPKMLTLPRSALSSAPSSGSAA